MKKLPDDASMAKSGDGGDAGKIIKDCEECHNQYLGAYLKDGVCYECRDLEA